MFLSQYNGGELNSLWCISFEKFNCPCHSVAIGRWENAFLRLLINQAIHQEQSFTVGVFQHWLPVSASGLFLYLFHSTFLIVCVFLCLSPCRKQEKENSKIAGYTNSGSCQRLQTGISADWHCRRLTRQHIQDVNGNHSPGIHSHSGLIVCV